MKRKYIKPEMQIIASHAGHEILVGSMLDHAESKGNPNIEFRDDFEDMEEDSWGNVDYGLWDDQEY